MCIRRQMMILRAFVKIKFELHVLLIFSVCILVLRYLTLKSWKEKKGHLIVHVRMLLWSNSAWSVLVSFGQWDMDISCIRRYDSQSINCSTFSQCTFSTTCCFLWIVKTNSWRCNAKFDSETRRMFGRMLASVLNITLANEVMSAYESNWYVTLRIYPSVNSIPRFYESHWKISLQ